MASLSIAPASGSITAVVSACVVSVTAADSNDESAYDDEEVPTEPEIRYYFTLSATGEDTLRSHEFSTNADGEATWINVIFPAAGSWTLALKLVEDDSTVTSTAVTVN